MENTNEPNEPNERIKTIEYLEKFYIIGDVHGEITKLEKLIKKLPKDATNKNIIFVGDLVDRGENSRKVLNFIRDNEYMSIKGNHEELMIDAINEYSDFESLSRTSWFYNGGDTTLSEYFENGRLNEKAYEELLNDVNFINSLPDIIVTNSHNHLNLMVSHAPFSLLFERYEKVLRKSENKEELDIEESHQLYNLSQLSKWNREKITRSTKSSLKFFNISGHNILKNYLFSNGEIKEPYNMDNLKDCYIDEELQVAFIDTGAFINYESCYEGYLTCLEYPSLKTYVQR